MMVVLDDLFKCGAEGPEGLVCIDELEHDPAMHMAVKTNGVIKYWTKDWKRNENRTTWRS